MDANPSINNRRPTLNYNVKTSGFGISKLKKTESVSRKSLNGQVLHVVNLFYFDKEGSEPSSIKIASYRKGKDSQKWDFEHPLRVWSGSLADASLFNDVLDDKFPNGGKYHQLSGDGAVDTLVADILSGGLSAETVNQVMVALAKNPEAKAIFENSDASQLLATTVNQLRQRKAVDELELAAKNPASTEQDLQRVLDKQWWIFGGRYIDKAKRRSLTVLDQMDIPLIRGDGSLHLVELKQANIPKLIKMHRNHLITGDEVHEAASQAMNYLLALDEHRAQILTDLKVDVRRATATVVIGHLDYCNFDAKEIHEALRTYNSHLSRIEVITYDELIEGARRSLDLVS